MDRVYFPFVVQPFDYLILLSLQTTTELEYLFLDLQFAVTAGGKHAILIINFQLFSTKAKSWPTRR